MTKNKPTITDTQKLRWRAIKHIEDGAVTEGYRGDLDKIIPVLNGALATEIVCVLRYRRHYFMAQGIHANPVKEEFLQHANEELGHADLIASRIAQLGGEPDFNPEGLAERSHVEYKEGNSLVDMVKEDLIAERVALESYNEIIRFIGDKDPTTRRMLESILAMEEEHAADLASVLSTLDPTKQ